LAQTFLRQFCANKIGDWRKMYTLVFVHFFWSFNPAVAVTLRQWNLALVLRQF
jgi:hypothetical protein